MTVPTSLVTVTEEGEAIGTLRQFARGFDLSVGGLLEILETEAHNCVIFRGGVAPDQLLILDRCGVLALASMAGRGR
jgi:hypothetical protein